MEKQGRKGKKREWGGKWKEEQRKGKRKIKKTLPVLSIGLKLTEQYCHDYIPGPAEGEGTQMGKEEEGRNKVWRKGKEKISAIERRTVKYCIFVEALSFWSLRDSIIIITVIYWLKKKMVEGVRWGNEKGKERRNGEYRWMWDRKGKERELKTD